MDSADGLSPQGRYDFEQALGFFLTWGADVDPESAREHALLVATGMTEAGADEPHRAARVPPLPPLARPPARPPLSHG